MKIYISESLPCYRVYFEKDSKMYFVNFGNNSDRLTNTLRKKHKDTKIVYEYETNY